MSQALLGLAGRCSRHEVLGFRSQQMPHLCPPRQQNQQMAGQQLAKWASDRPWSGKCPPITCFCQHFVRLQLLRWLLGPHLADVCWHLPELTWNNSSGLSDPVQLLITKDDGREGEDWRRARVRRNVGMGWGRERTLVASHHHIKGGRQVVWGRESRCVFEWQMRGAASLLHG